MAGTALRSLVNPESGEGGLDAIITSLEQAGLLGITVSLSISNSCLYFSRLWENYQSFRDNPGYVLSAYRGMIASYEAYAQMPIDEKKEKVRIERELADVMQSHLPNAVNIGDFLHNFEEYVSRVTNLTDHYSYLTRNSAGTTPDFAAERKNTPWDQEIFELNGRMRADFGTLSPEAQRDLGSWLGEIWYTRIQSARTLAGTGKEGSTTQDNVYERNVEKLSSLFLEPFGALPQNTREQPEFYLKIADAVLNAYGLQRKPYSPPQIENPRRMLFRIIPLPLTERAH